MSTPVYIPDHESVASDDGDQVVTINDQELDVILVDDAPSDVEVVEVIGSQSGVDQDVQILGLQTATVRFQDTPIYLPGETVFTPLRPTQGLFVEETPDATRIRFERRQRHGRVLFSALQLAFRRRLPLFFGGDDDAMREVAAMENRELEDKFRTQKRHAAPFKERMEMAIQKLPEEYSSKLSPEIEAVCPLCGVVLGEGIPDDFKHVEGDFSKEQNYLGEIQRLGCQAPYQLLNLVTDLDRELSRKVYFARCGHVYCGRCAQRIAGRGAGRVKGAKNIDNPGVFAPKRCVAEGEGGSKCGGRLWGGKFVEVYTRL